MGPGPGAGWGGADWNGTLLLLLPLLLSGSGLCNQARLKIVLHSAWTPLCSYLWSGDSSAGRGPVSFHYKYMEASKCGDLGGAGGRFGAGRSQVYTRDQFEELFTHTHLQLR